MVAVRGFKKRSFVKSKTLKDDKDRDAQFQKINTLTEQCLNQGIPVLCIDTKKQATSASKPDSNNFFIIIIVKFWKLNIFCLQRYVLSATAADTFLPQADT